MKLKREITEKYFKIQYLVKLKMINFTLWFLSELTTKIQHVHLGSRSQGSCSPVFPVSMLSLANKLPPVQLYLTDRYASSKDSKKADEQISQMSNFCIKWNCCCKVCSVNECSVGQQRRQVSTILVADSKQLLKLRKEEHKSRRGKLKGTVICLCHTQ